jgi:hypothetical protein
MLKLLPIFCTRIPQSCQTIFNKISAPKLFCRKFAAEKFSAEINLQKKAAEKLLRKNCRGKISAEKLPQKIFRGKIAPIHRYYFPNFFILFKFTFALFTLQIKPNLNNTDRQNIEIRHVFVFFILLVFS